MRFLGLPALAALIAIGLFWFMQWLTAPPDAPIKPPEPDRRVEIVKPPEEQEQPEPEPTELLEAAAPPSSPPSMSVRSWAPSVEATCCCPASSSCRAALAAARGIARGGGGGGDAAPNRNPSSVALRSIALQTPGRDGVARKLQMALFRIIIQPESPAGAQCCYP